MTEMTLYIHYIYIVRPKFDREDLISILLVLWILLNSGLWMFICTVCGKRYNGLSHVIFEVCIHFAF